MEAGGVSHTLVLSGISTVDVPDLPLPVAAEVPLLPHSPRLAEQLVSDEETAAWLGEHLPNGALAAAWSSDRVRAVLIFVVRDSLRDGMAPSVDDVAAWLVNAAAEDDSLLRAAHTAASPEDFGEAFAETADSLIAAGGSEHLLWTYLGAEGTRRAEVFTLATPDAYAQLLALPAPVDTQTAPLPAPTELPEDAPEESEMATPARPDESARGDSSIPVSPPSAAVPDVQPETGEDIEVQDPPEPQRFTTSAPLAAYDLHEVHLEGMDGTGFDRGELHREGVPIATLHRMDGGQWYARMQLDPPDLTRPVDDPQTAAANAAVMHAAFAGAPLGDPVVAAPGSNVEERAEQVRSELRAFAAYHSRSIEEAWRQLSPSYGQNPHREELAARLADVADAEGRGSRMMAADLAGVERAVNAWGGALPSAPISEFRAGLVFPLAHVLFDVRQLQARLQATVELATAEAAEERARQQEAVATAAPPAPATVPDEVPAAEARAPAAADPGEESAVTESAEQLSVDAPETTTEPEAPTTPSDDGAQPDTAPADEPEIPYWSLDDWDEEDDLADEVVMGSEGELTPSTPDLPEVATPHEGPRSSRPPKRPLSRCPLRSGARMTCPCPRTRADRGIRENSPRPRAPMTSWPTSRTSVLRGTTP
ncbi:hypothetical protein [Streptomyces sp. NPDC048350]|uniref:hypothetical protein n=1 Tax=Streptomyces sp. NPDC048350 TaxID=3365538 RepID=UPI0037146B3D